MRQRDWQTADLARASGLRHGSLSRILSESRRAGPEACRAIAEALDLPDVMVFRKAGWLSPEPEPNERTEQLLHQFDRLEEEDQELAIVLLESIAERRARYDVD